MLLNTYLAHAGVASRRKAVEIIKAGQVSVNRQTETNPAYRVQETDVVKVGNRIITLEKKVYILLNKPAGYLSTTAADQSRPTVLSLLPKNLGKRLYPVGRLDVDTTGLLLITNDGQLANRLAHPRYEIRKTYSVFLDKPLDPADEEQIKKGIYLPDGKIKIDALSMARGRPRTAVKVTLHSGRFRIIKRLFAAIGYTVTSLDRVSFSGIEKRGLARGKWRFLTAPEIRFLKKLAEK
jgi:23S rRNA pseudouridine2605 synthase